MKKLAYLLALPLFMYSCGSAEQKPAESTETADTTETVEMIRSDWENDHLHGKVKSIEETPYTADKDGNIGEMDSCCVSMEMYNEHGFMTKETEKNSAGETTETGVIDRDEMGRFMGYTATADGRVVFKRVVERDTEGNAISAVDTDTTGQVTRKHTVDDANEHFQALSGKSYLADGTYLGTWSYDYVDGMRVSSGWVDSTDVQRMKRTGELNDLGWISKSVEVKVGEDGNTTTTTTTYTYDSFDDAGNWTQKTKYENDEPVAVMKRSYTYYAE